eukprot:SAG11_NODE_305_length_10996_cov_4.698082_12_plen_84_part_00
MRILVLCRHLTMCLALTIVERSVCLGRTQANVLDFKKALATKMAAEGIEAQPEHLRVRELGTPTWPGKVFIDSQRVIGAGTPL